MNHRISFVVSSMSLLPLTGCFSLLNGFGAWDHEPSTTSKVVAGTLDVATSPVQIVVFGPPLLCAWIDENTGENGRRKREREHFAEEKQMSRGELAKDFQVVYSCPDYLALTNTPAREALSDYLNCNWRDLSQTNANRLADISLEHVELLTPFQSVWRNENIPLPMRMTAVEKLEGLHDNSHDARSTMWAILGNKSLSDEDLEGVAGRVNGEGLASKVVAEVLSRRKRERENQARQLEHEREWKRKQEEVRRKMAAEERQKRIARQEEIRRHNEEMRRLAKNITAEPEAFAEVIPYLGDDVVENAVYRAVMKKEQPFPATNLVCIIDEAIRSRRRHQHVLRMALKRQELTAEQLRAYYPKVLELQRIEGVSECMSGLLANPNLPVDVARAAWHEPQLAEVRDTYLYHVVLLQMGADERERFRAERRAAEAEWGKKCKGRSDRNKRLDSFQRKYLPKEMPEGWTRALP